MGRRSFLRTLAGGLLTAPLAAEITRLTASIFIIAIASTDFVVLGWAATCARPGGNITGFMLDAGELNAKRFELLKDSASLPDVARRAAGYVDRILKGERPADLPIQRPVKLELAVNLKAAKTIGLVLPPSLLQRADQVIE